MEEKREKEIFKRKNIEGLSVGDNLLRKDTGEHDKIREVLVPKELSDELVFYFKGYLVSEKVMENFFEGAHNQIFCYA